MTHSALAYAKVNLGLQILGKRTDGYHDINSVFVPIDLYDEVEIEPAANLISLECTPSVTLAPELNLAFIAASKLKAAIGLNDLGVKIHLTKRIPHGAGLGGGSSDAATTLRLLQKVWPSATDAIVEQVAARIGSDVPFFLKNSVAVVSGRGEVVTPLDVHLPWTFLLLAPNIHIDTGHAYSTLGITDRHEPNDLSVHLSEAIENNALNIGIFRNDFEASVYSQHPYLLTLKDALLETGSVYASMTGSGSTIFGLYTDVENAMKAESVINMHHTALRTYICQPV